MSRTDPNVTGMLQDRSLERLGDHAARLSAGERNRSGGIVVIGDGPTPPSFVGGPYINILDKGGVADGVTDNTDALRTALGVSSAEGGAVYIPDGTFFFDATVPLDGSGASITVPGNAVIIFQSRAAVFKIGADGYNLSISLLIADGTDRLEIYGGTFEGPVTVGSVYDLVAIKHDGTVPGGKIICHGTKFRRFRRAALVGTGRVAHLEFHGCEFEGIGTGATRGRFGIDMSEAGAGASVKAVDCDFHDLGANGTGIDNSNFVHAVYLSTAVDAHFEGCTFDAIGTAGNSVTVGSHTLPVATLNLVGVGTLPTSGTVYLGGHAVTYTGKGTNSLTGCAGGSGVIAAGTPVIGTGLGRAFQQYDETVPRLTPAKYVRLIDCYFGPAVAIGIRPSDQGTWTEVTDCTFNTPRKAVDLRGCGVVRGCKFTSKGSIGGFWQLGTDSAVTPHLVNPYWKIIGNSFDTLGLNNQDIYVEQVNATLELTDNTFRSDVNHHVRWASLGGRMISRDNKYVGGRTGWYAIHDANPAATSITSIGDTFAGVGHGIRMGGTPSPLLAVVGAEFSQVGIESILFDFDAIPTNFYVRSCYGTRGFPDTGGITVDGIIPVFNVKDFGAIGDGVTDDNNAIQAALDAASGLADPYVSTAGDPGRDYGVPIGPVGGTVYFPPGIYISADQPYFAWPETGNIRVPSNVTVMGAGWQSVLRNGPGGYFVTSISFVGASAPYAGTGPGGTNPPIFRFQLTEDPTIDPVQAFVVGSPSSPYVATSGIVNVNDVRPGYNIGPAGIIRGVKVDAANSVDVEHSTFTSANLTAWGAVDTAPGMGKIGNTPPWQLLVGAGGPTRGTKNVRIQDITLDSNDSNRAAASSTLRFDGSGEGTGLLFVHAVADNGGLIQVQTYLPHGLKTNDEVEIGGNTNFTANGRWRITVVSANHFTLQGSVWNANAGIRGVVRPEVFDDPKIAWCENIVIENVRHLNCQNGGSLVSRARNCWWIRNYAESRKGTLQTWFTPQGVHYVENIIAASSDDMIAALCQNWVVYPPIKTTLSMSGGLPSTQTTGPITVVSLSTSAPLQFPTRAQIRIGRELINYNGVVVNGATTDLGTTTIGRGVVQAPEDGVVSDPAATHADGAVVLLPLSRENRPCRDIEIRGNIIGPYVERYVRPDPGYVGGGSVDITGVERAVIADNIFRGALMGIHVTNAYGSGNKYIRIHHNILHEVSRDFAYIGNPEGLTDAERNAAGSQGRIDTKPLRVDSGSALSDEDNTAGAESIWITDNTFINCRYRPITVEVLETNHPFSGIENKRFGNSIRDVHIKNNHILWDYPVPDYVFQDTGYGWNGFRDSTHGIKAGMWSVFSTNYLENVTIAGNVIRGAPGLGIDVWQEGDATINSNKRKRRFRIIDNEIYNCGQDGVDWAVSYGMRFSDVEHLLVRGNVATDDQQFPSQKYAMRLEALAGTVIIADNEFPGPPDGNDFGSVSYNAAYFPMPSGSHLHIRNNAGWDPWRGYYGGTWEAAVPVGLAGSRKDSTGTITFLPPFPVGVAPAVQLTVNNEWGTSAAALDPDLVGPPINTSFKIRSYWMDVPGNFTGSPYVVWEANEHEV